jgi:serine phosphatase RsbU (regulator of sigma subunit)
MRILGDRSLASLLKVIIDIAYFVALGLVALVVASLVLVAGLSPSNLSVGLPARVEIDPSAYELQDAAGKARSVTIESLEGEVHVDGVTPARLAQGFAMAVVLLGGAALVLRQFRGIFRTLKAGRPFVQENVRRIRTIGLVVIAGELVGEAATSWSSWTLGREFTSSAISFRSNFELNLTVIFAGALLLVLAEVFREAASLKRDLETARQIQFELVADEEVRRDGISIRSRMRPANTVGGDYYDVIPLDDGKLAVVQADVAGKGMPAALLMAVLQGSLRTLLSAGFRGARLIDALNEYLDDNTPSNRMVTLFYGELDPASGELEFVNAGHNLPFVQRADGSLERPGTASRVLGILPGTSFEQATLRLGPGDRMLLFTDGISEAFAPDGEEFGDERVGEHLRSHARVDDNSLIDDLVERVLAHCHPGKPGDDMTLTLIARD